MTPQKNVYEVCKIRTMYGFSCRGCRYNGDICNKYKEVFRVSRPVEYKIEKERRGKEK